MPATSEIKIRGYFHMCIVIYMRDSKATVSLRQHKLLSPYRRRPAPRELHDRTITTDAPNVMWGTDGTQVLTVEDGYVLVFSAVEHWRPASF